MYSSSNSINPFPQLPPSLHLSPAPSFLSSLDHHDYDINFLHQQHSDLLLSEFLYTDYPLIETTLDPGKEVSSKAKPTNQETSGHEQVINGSRHYIINPQNLLPRKKDRHSKIYTAQGPRDRRVRLSIDISRKFFDLQDLLGFDKASKTLDWLLTNSKAAIKELMLAKNRSNGGGEKSFSSANSECEMGSQSGTNGGDDGGLMGIVSKRTRPLTSLSEEGRQKRPHKIAFAKESRAKARARARERTREKMCTKRVNGFEDAPPDSSPADHVLSPSASLSQIGASDQRMVDSHNHNKITTSSIMKNLAKDVISCPSIPQNWDIVDHTPQLILCYDQHEYLRPANLGEVWNSHSRP